MAGRAWATKKRIKNSEIFHFSFCLRASSSSSFTLVSLACSLLLSLSPVPIDFYNDPSVRNSCPSYFYTPYCPCTHRLRSKMYLHLDRCIYYLIARWTWSKSVLITKPRAPALCPPFSICERCHFAHPPNSCVLLSERQYSVGVVWLIGIRSVYAVPLNRYRRRGRTSLSLMHGGFLIRSAELGAAQSRSIALFLFFCFLTSNDVSSFSFF
ncbi:MAG: hypothetical protein JOS17DRAFT_136007 [Linnemannia elongata]|nr:MAG: hypothetical protein JOS17DRAFT_136007 [Linnemannia elongata]